MPCFAPLRAYYGSEKGSSGKRPLVFDIRKAFSGAPVRLPCGQCIGCRLEHSRMWAMRCMHEKRMHDRSSFLTLTYDDDNLPLLSGPLIAKRQTLFKRDLQLFMKRLRDQFGEGVRFYGCGEYGEDNGRPHYHVLLFNVDFDDKLLFTYNKRKEPIYTSKRLSRIWNMGHCAIGSVDFDSCAYVARYVVKKITGKGSSAHYGGREPEFVVMSRRPGVGREFYMKYAHEIYAHDSVILRGVEVKPPRYYDDLYRMLDSMRIDELKVSRRRTAIMRSRLDNTPERRRVREVVELRRLANKERKL